MKDIQVDKSCMSRVLGTRNADDLLLALSPQDESRLGLIFISCFLMFSEIPDITTFPDIGWCKGIGVVRCATQWAQRLGSFYFLVASALHALSVFFQFFLIWLWSDLFEIDALQSWGIARPFFWASNLRIVGHHRVHWRHLCGKFHRGWPALMIFPWNCYAVRFPQ